MAHRQSAFILRGDNPREITYGAGVAVVNLTKWDEFDDPPLFDVQKERVDNRSRAKGHLGPTKAGTRVVGLSVEPREFKFPLRIDLFQFFLKLLLSNGVGAGAGPFTQTMIEPAPGTGPFSTSLVMAGDRNTPGSFFQYNGAYCSQLEFTVDENPEIICTAQVGANGSEIDVSGTVSAPAIGSADEGGDDCLGRGDLAAMQIGPTGSEVDLLNPNIFNAITFRFIGENAPKRRASGSLEVPSLRFGEGPNLEVELKIKAHKGDTPYSWYRDGTPPLSDDTSLHKSFRIARDAGHFIDIDLPDCIIDVQDAEYDEQEKAQTLPLTPNWDATALSRFTVVTSSDVQNLLETS